MIQKRISFKDNPGPGAYEAVELNPTIIKTKVSKYKGPKLGVRQTEPRFTDPKDAPGPSSYHTPDEFSASARYVLSKYTGRGRRPFTT